MATHRDSSFVQSARNPLTTQNPLPLSTQTTPPTCTKSLRAQGSELIPSLATPIRRSAGWNHVDHEFHVADKMPDYAHADPCRQEMRSVYIFDLFVSRPSAPDLSTKLAQLKFKAVASPAHLTEVNVGVFFEQANPHLPAHSSAPQLPSSPFTQPPNHIHMPSLDADTSFNHATLYTHLT